MPTGMRELIQEIMLIRSMSQEGLDRVKATESLDMDGIRRHYLEKIGYAQD
jgi:hypothetical protein